MTSAHEVSPPGSAPTAGPIPGGHSQEVAALEPAVSPTFRTALRGYERREVDEYVEYQRHRLAAVRQRAQHAERELAWTRRSPGEAVEHPPAVVTSLPLAAAAATSSTSRKLADERLLLTTGGRKLHLSATTRQSREKMRRLVRYAACSIASIAFTEALLFVLYGELRIASAVVCSVAASAGAAIPTYILYRHYVWDLRGRSRVWGEIVPFWVTTAAGIAVATLGVAALVHFLPRLHLHGHLARAAVVDGASLASYGILWVARFFILDRFIFGGARASVAAREDAEDPRLVAMRVPMA